jgi:hypothetical protein
MLSTRATKPRTELEKIEKGRLEKVLKKRKKKYE